jgi:quinol monooxygenase YgiN
MLIVHVSIHVKPEYIHEFIQVSLDNAQNSINEPGIARFDLIQQEDDPTHFMLLEVYKNEVAPLHHKETEHYARWKEAVAGLMAEPRQAIKYINLFPADDGW